MSCQGLLIRRDDHEDRMNRESVGIEVAPGCDDCVRIDAFSENIQRRDLKLTEDLAPFTAADHHGYVKFIFELGPGVYVGMGHTQSI